MRRRDISKLALAIAGVGTLANERARANNDVQLNFPRTPAETAVGIEPTNAAQASGPTRYGALGDGNADDTGAWKEMGRIGGHHFVADGTYRITSKVQTSVFTTIEGATRQNTILLSAGFHDYVLEIGNKPHGPNPNVGALQRLRFFGGTGNTALLHMNQLSHMWRLDDLLFQAAPCPALIVDNCWDSNYSNIDILGCGSPLGNDPAVGAMVIVKSGSNNIYLRGLRMEHAPSGALYVGDGCSPIYVITGKIDQGFIAQGAAAVTVSRSAILVMDDYNITGVLGHPAFEVGGSLLLGNVSVYGGTGCPVINDTRAWVHLDGLTIPGAAGASFGPALPSLNLGSSQFYRVSPSSNVQTTSVLHSKVFPVRLVDRLAVIANGTVYEDRILVQTGLTRPANNLLDNCYLVHNPTGTDATGQAGSRRKILTSYSNGQLLLQGNWPCMKDAEWSVEYCAGHYTPNLAIGGIQMDPGMTLFTVLHTGLKIRDAPSYISTNADEASGSTQFTVASTKAMPREDLKGYFLVDEATGEPFLISYGLDSTNRMAVIYDRRSSLKAARSYAVIAGYAANISQTGSSLEWSYAGTRKSVSLPLAMSYGFDAYSLPLWGVGPATASSQ